MKKIKTTTPFWFKDTSHQEVCNILNKENPINLKYNEDLVNRVFEKYPVLNKSEISVILTGVFQSIRDLLILGKILNFHNLFFDLKLHFFAYRKNGHILPCLKAKIKTPPKLRKI